MSGDTLCGRLLPLTTVFTHSEVMMLAGKSLTIPCDSKAIWLGYDFHPTGRRAEVLGYGWFCCAACGVAMRIDPKDSIDTYPFQLKESL